MTRRSSRRSPNSAPKPPVETKAVVTRSRRKPAETQQTTEPVGDLKKVYKRLENMPKGEEVQDEETTKAVDKKPTRRTRASAKTDDDAHAKDAKNPQDQKAAGAHGRGRPKRKNPKEQDPIKPGTKRQASDLPLRPARKLRNGKSPKPEPKPASPPPITPANPPEESSSGSEDQENAPPEPVSGRHIYGALIKPTTLTFNPDNEPTTRALPRQTRKRGRADQDPPPTQVQIDSDPRDIDATGFLSELDPKEMRRRKPRLSRLQQERVEEPPWSQEFPAALETPLLTPAIDGPGDKIAALSSPARPVVVEKNCDKEAAVELLLLDLLPGIPDTSTPYERGMLENRISLIQRDIIAYRTAVSDIEARVDG